LDEKMRISESRIRRIIREEAQQALREMPYAGSLGIRRGTENWKPAADDRDRLPEKINVTGAEKFARSGRFTTQAKKLYANFPNNVWLASWAGDSRELEDIVSEFADLGQGGEYSGNIRVMSTDLVPDGIRILETIGFESPARVAASDFVILHSIANVDRENLATPWMIFHAMFDDVGGAPADFIPSWDDLMGDMYALDKMKFSDGSPVDTSSTDDLGRIFTMGSARAGRLQGDGNAVAEALCQELLTKGGFRFMSDDLDDDSISIMEDLAEHVRTAADEFRSSTRGKLLTVSAS
jgi:hypothetical protein